MNLLQSLINASATAFFMFWEVLWPLILGFTLSGGIQALVSHKQMAHVLGKTSAKSLTLAALFGAASSSCSYAAVALARSIFVKGASFTAAMVFELASTNLVIELGIILYVLLGWQFMLAELVGGIIMIVLISIIFRFTLSERLLRLARKQAEKGVLGRMEGHAQMDMSLTKVKNQKLKVKIEQVFTAIANYFVMDWAAVWIDILLGFLIAGGLSVLVPQQFWQTFFLTHNPQLASMIGPLIGPLIAILSFVCSVGNVPLAAVLWHGGISFGGVISFLFADLIVLPLLDIYRKYYGWKVTGYIFVTFYLTMAAAGYIVEFLFGLFHLLPTNRNTGSLTEGIQWNYTIILNILFLLIAVALVLRFVKTGGLAMLSMMEKKH